MEILEKEKEKEKEMDAASDDSLSRKKVKVDAVWIPIDLVVDIVMRLSARDVVRARSVCKELSFQLTTPEFISLHYNLSLQTRHENASSFVYLRHVPPRPSFRSYSTIEYPSPESVALTFLTLEQPTTSKLVAKVDKEEDLIAMLSSILFPSCPTERDWDELQMICPFDGLICFGCGKSVILYNPATRESQVLPSDPELPNYSRHILGVWFESTAKPHYKVFRKVRDEHDSFKILTYDSTVDSWRVSKTVDGVVAIDHRLAFLLNGVVYLKLFMKDSGVSVIVTFDAKLETFGYLEMPPSFARRPLVSLLPFRGNLACMDLYIDINDDIVKFDLWVMTEYQSWTQKFRVPSDFPGIDMDGDEYEFHYASPIAFWKNMDQQDELLLTKDGKTLSFNLNTKKMTNLKLSHLPCNKVMILPYNVESLLSLK